MSRTNRKNNRNGGGSAHGEEAIMWQNIKSDLAEILAEINNDNDNLARLIELDKAVGAMDPEKVTGVILKSMEDVSRKGVKNADNIVVKLRAIIESLEVLKGVVDAKEQAEGSGSSSTAVNATLGKRERRGGGGGGGGSTDREAASLYEFDAGVDSPAPGPSPLGGSSSRKYGDRASTRDRERDREARERREEKEQRDKEKERDSMPPNKADSVEPQGSVGSGVGGSSTSNPRKAQPAVFTKGDSVAFRPDAEWILGKVAQVVGEGKARRYKVLDIEPEDLSKQKEYRTTAKNMIAITPAGKESRGLKDWGKGQVVLALYPATTTFYKAEVHSMDDDDSDQKDDDDKNGDDYGGKKVNLKFEGESDHDMLQQVERRFVIEYRA